MKILTVIIFLLSFFKGLSKNTENKNPICFLKKETVCIKTKACLSLKTVSIVKTTFHRTRCIYLPIYNPHTDFELKVNT